MTNEEVVEQIQYGNNVKANLEILYEQNKRFIYLMTKPFLKYAEADDLMQEAYIGLHNAVMSYSSDRAKFITYAAWKIRQQCIKFIQNSDTKRIPVHMKQLIFKYNKFVNDYILEHTEEPNDITICKKLQIEPEKLEFIKKTLYEQQCISIYETAPGTEKLSLKDVIADTFDMEEFVEEQDFQQYKKKVINESIDSIPPREGEIIRGKYFDGLMHSELANKMNVSVSRIGQLEKIALKSLKKLEKLQNLMDEEYGYDSQIAYHVSKKFCLDRRTSQTELLALKRLKFEEDNRINFIEKKFDNAIMELSERQMQNGC